MQQVRVMGTFIVIHRCVVFINVISDVVLDLIKSTLEQKIKDEQKKKCLESNGQLLESPFPLHCCPVLTSQSSLFLGTSLITVRYDWDFSYESIMLLIKEKLPEIIVHVPSAPLPNVSHSLLSTSTVKSSLEPLQQPSKLHVGSAALLKLYGVGVRTAQQWLGVL
jgi:hypothetical protein